MISIIAFIVVMFGSLNWLCVGFFQYDLVAGLFGYQGSIFSRIVYIVVGICAIYLIFVIIKNKGRLTVKKLKKEEQPIVDQITKKPPEQVAADQQIADNIKYESEHHQQLNAEQAGQNNAYVVYPQQNTSALQTDSTAAANAQTPNNNSHINTQNGN